MAPGDDEDWTFDAADTMADDRTPVPEAVPEELIEAAPSTATTAKFKTLSGFEEAASREISGTRDLLRGRDQVFCAYRLMLIAQGFGADAADMRAQLLREWLAENETLVDEAMKE